MQRDRLSCYVLILRVQQPFEEGKRDTFLYPLPHAVNEPALSYNEEMRRGISHDELRDHLETHGVALCIALVDPTDYHPRRKEEEPLVEPAVFTPFVSYRLGATGKPDLYYDAEFTDPDRPFGRHHTRVNLQLRRPHRVLWETRLWPVRRGSQDWDRPAHLVALKLLAVRASGQNNVGLSALLNPHVKPQVEVLPDPEDQWESGPSDPKTYPLSAFRLRPPITPPKGLDPSVLEKNWSTLLQDAQDLLDDMPGANPSRVWFPAFHQQNPGRVRIAPLLDYHALSSEHISSVTLTMLPAPFDGATNDGWRMVAVGPPPKNSRDAFTVEEVLYEEAKGFVIHPVSARPATRWKTLAALITAGGSSFVVYVPYHVGLDTLRRTPTQHISPYLPVILPGRIWNAVLAGDDNIQRLLDRVRGTGGGTFQERAAAKLDPKQARGRKRRR